MTLRRSLLLGLLALSRLACADGLSGRVGIASDAFFRGLPQNNGPSFEARADYLAASGLYAGGQIANDRSVGDARLDLRAGLSRSLQFDGYLPYRIDAGLSGAAFSGGRRGAFGRDPAYLEGYGSVGVGPLSGSLAIAPDFFGLGGAGYRVGGALRMPLLPRWTVGLQAGWNGGEGLRRYLAIRSGGREARNYFDGGATVSVSLPFGFSVYAQAAATSLSSERGPRGLAGLRKQLDF